MHSRRRLIVALAMSLVLVTALSIVGATGAEPTLDQADAQSAGSQQGDFHSGDIGYEIVPLSAMADASISRYSPNQNTASQWSLALRSVDDAALVYKFDVSSIAAREGVAVAQATLKLFVKTRSNSQSLVATAYGLKKPWTEAEVTWNTAMTETKWTVAGANGETDRDTQSSGSATLSQEGVWMTVDVTSIVNRWVTGQLENNGITIKAMSGGSVSYYVASRESADTSTRPVLEVAMAILPTPTATLSPTPTSTPLPRVGLDKTGPQGPLHVAGYTTIAYTIVASNQTMTDLTGIVITDYLPLGTEFIEASGGGAYNPNDDEGGTVTWDLGDLTVGMTDTVTIELGIPTWVKEQGNIVNMARANCANCSLQSEDYWEIRVLIPSPTPAPKTPTPEPPNKMYIVAVHNGQ